LDAFGTHACGAKCRPGALAAGINAAAGARIDGFGDAGNLVTHAVPGDPAAGRCLVGAHRRLVVNAAIDAELQYKIPAESVVVDPVQWKNLVAMQIYLKNVKGSIPFEQILDNSDAEKAVASIKK
jgi:hypothetical protein